MRSLPGSSVFFAHKHVISNPVIPCFRVPLHKTRSLRRLISDNGKSLEELRALASSTGAPDSSPSPKLPVERLTNFMDVCKSTVL